jgi:hypothetical protein
MDYKKRIAVIAVHGVGHQLPRTSAQRAADLLRNQCEGYDWLGQSTIRIPVTAASTDLKHTGTCDRNEKKDRAQYVSQILKRAIERTSNDVDQRTAKCQIPLEVQDMQERLLGYKPRAADVTYETTRIELQRVDGSECHVFEMFWGDISRPHQRKKIIGTVVDFYQLLFFLSDLGGRVIHYARAEYARNDIWWLVLDRVHWLAHMILVLGVPILNLSLFGLTIPAALSGYSEKFNIPKESLALFPGGVVFGLVAAAFVFWKQNVRAYFWPWTFLALSMVLLLPVALNHFDVIEFKRSLPLMTWLTMACSIYGLMCIYERFRGGASIWSVAILLLATFIFSWQLNKSGWPSTWQEIFEACRESVSQAILWIHRPLWIGFALFSLACWLISEGAIRSSKLDRKNMDRARRAALTAQVSLAIPGILVLTVDLGLWQLFVWGLDKLPGNLLNVDQLNEALVTFNLSVPPGTAYGLMLFFLAALFAAWLFLPAALAEGHPSNDARWLGTVLSVGFRKLKYSAWAMQLLITVGLLLDSVLIWYKPRPSWALWDGPAVFVVGGALFALFAFRGAGEAIRSVLDIALDVANWLRHDPPRETPRARICARYTSLLKYICSWRDLESNEPYKAIIILSHSQGAVIAAELFRFLTYVAEPDLERIFDGHGDSERLPVYLFTMGCPLRQLYGLRFPDEYSWATEPNPDDLGVELWSNSYSSGDYVGRALWQLDSGQNGTYVSGSLDDGKRHERCIGAGAHTHYWDETAPEIAQELDHLIEACSGSKL